MGLLIAAILIALLVTVGLPIIASLWLNKNLAVSWRVIIYGVLGYFVVQFLVTLLFSGVMALYDLDVLNLSAYPLYTVQLVSSVLFGAIVGVVVRWAVLRYAKEPLINLESAYGIGIGFGGTESIVRVGLPLLFTFITMLSNFNIDPQTSSLEPGAISQFEALWQVPAFVPLAGSMERLAALFMHLTVMVLILQTFTRNNNLWLGAAIGLELLVNGLMVWLALEERFAGNGMAYGWMIGLALFLMVGNFYLLFSLNGFDVDITKAKEGA